MAKFLTFTHTNRQLFGCRKCCTWLEINFMATRQGHTQLTNKPTSNTCF